MSDVTRQEIDEWMTGLRGSVIQPDDADYDAARQVWNGMIDCRPAAVARCAGVADVQAALAFARSRGMRVAVRGGGHNIAGTGVCDGGLVIDLSMQRGVRVDPDARMAWVDPGATLADFDHEAQAFGLATPLGINSTTGVAGLTLGGGFGWLTRRHGMTVDNLLGAQMVTADGKLHRLDARHEKDLFWAIRGGGGNFGIVTMFEFGLHPVGPEIYGGLVVYPADQADQVLPAYRQFIANASDDLAVWAVLRLAPPLPFLPASVHGQPVIVFASCYVGKPGSGPDTVAPVRGFGQPCGEHLGPMPYTAWQKAFDPLLTPGARNYWKSHNLASLSEPVFAALVQALREVPSPECEIFVAALGGQARNMASDAMAYAHRDADYIVNIHGRWQRPEDDARCVGWARESFDRLSEFSLGTVYVNFLTSDESPRVNAAYGPNYERLARIKGQIDPQNLFRGNQNIAPLQ
ncbi:FAD-binding oxidoreductase [Paracidovorax citrulli]